MAHIDDPENLLTPEEQALLASYPQASHITILSLIGEGASGSKVLLGDFHFATTDLRACCDGPNFIKIDHSRHVLTEAARHSQARAGIEAYAPQLVDTHTRGLLTAVLYSPAGESVLQAESLSRLIRRGRFAHDRIASALNLLGEAVLMRWNTAPAHETLPVYEGLLRIINCGSQSGKRLDEAIGLGTILVAASVPRLWITQVRRDLPNPAYWIATSSRWPSTNLSFPIGRVHGDLHGGNLLCRYDQPKRPPYLIDFARYQHKSAPRFFDLAYLEIDVLLTYLTRSNANWEDWIDLLEVMTASLVPTQSPKRPVPLAASMVIQPIRKQAQALVDQAAVALRDQFEVSWWLALSAVALIFARRDSYEGKIERQITFLVAAYAMERVLKALNIEQPGVPVPFDLETPTAKSSLPAELAKKTTTSAPRVTTTLEARLAQDGRFEAIAKLLIPHMDSVAARRALLDTLFLGKDDKPDFVLEGATETVVRNVMNQLIRYGELAPGEQALAGLIRLVRDKYGANHQPKMDALVAAINDTDNLPILSARWKIIPGGTFNIGDARFPNAQVCAVSCEAFYLARTPVTQHEYSQFVRDTGHPVPEAWDEAYQWDAQRLAPPAGKTDHPVVYVNAADVEAYCQWLGNEMRAELADKLPGWYVKLPTEVEWERAARGDDGRAYAWGARGGPDKTYCNFGGYYSGTTPVEHFAKANAEGPYGCLDLCGNVWEWTCSEAEDRRVVRGGCWEEGLSLDTLHAAWRAFEKPDQRLPTLGFRVAIVRS